jgi:hypothetical protein
MPSYLPFALVAGLGSAVLYAAALDGSMVGIVLAYTAMLPLFLIGLSFGNRAIVVAATAASIAIVLFGGIVPGLIFGVSHGLPTCAVTILALHNRKWTDGNLYWYPAGRLLMALSLWSGALIAIVGFAFWLFASGFADGVEQFLQAMAQTFAQAGNVTVNSSAFEQVTIVLPGVVALSWMLMATVNGLLAQTVLRRLGKNLRPSLRLAEVKISGPWIGTFVVSVLGGLLIPGDVGFSATNIAIVMAYPLFLQGLSVIHSVIHHWGGGPLAVGLFYALLIFMGWLALAVVALGLAEPVVRLRTRIAGRHNI